MNIIKSIIIFAVILISLSGVTQATDWTFYNPTGLGYTDGGNGQDTFMITGNNASNGYVQTWFLSAVPAATNGYDIIDNGNNILYAMSDPTTPHRVFFTTEAGDVGYTDDQSGGLSYAAGYYTEVGGICTICNPMYRIGTFTATSEPVPIAIDSGGNVYIANGLVITKFIKSSGYAQQAIYTMIAGTTFTQSAGSGGTSSSRVIDIKIDSSDYLHLLVGSSIIGFSGSSTSYLNMVIMSNTGTLINSIVIEEITGLNAAGGALGYINGGLILDTINPNNNYTYVIMRDLAQFTDNSYIIHNSSSGSVDVGGGALATFTRPYSIGYDNHLIYIAGAPNLIRSYATNYEGYEYSSTGGAGAISGVTGTFVWVNGYQQSITTITPGQSLSYMWTISGDQENYTYYAGWGSNTATEPQNLYDLTDLTELPTPATFSTPSIDVAGTDIYGYFIAKHKTTNLWYRVTNPVKLTISQTGVGYDSITPDKAFYNLTGDTVNVALTYGGISYIYFYQWMLCERIDCADKDVWEGVSLIGRPATSHIDTTGIKQGNYYTVLMRHLPLLPNEIVATNYIQIRPPVIGVSWDKASYNLFPKSLTTNTCLDATPAYNPWSNISGYAGLQTGWFSCSTTPATATANNSIMRGSLYAAYNGTFYLNNSLGSVWNGTLSNGSGALIYTLTNSSVTETWTLIGVNQSGETFYATTEVVAESAWGYSLSVSPNPAYNQDTLFLTFTKPIWIDDYVQLKDAGGTTVFVSTKGQTSGTYYIDPAKQYTYGTWTAYWVVGSIGSVKTQGQHIYTFTVKNAGRPSTNGSVIAEDSAEYTSTEITNLLSSKIFWALLFIIGIMLVVAVKERGG